MFSKLTKLTLIFALLPFIANAAEITVNDAWIEAGEQKTMTADNVYILDKFVFVEDGAELTIEPGTIIKGNHGTGDQASALIICRGGKIYAEGTSDNPIIFTHVDDDPMDLTDGPLDVDGQWGGVIILGKASVNTATGVAQIEGIPSDNPKGEFGGGATPDDNDNSGVFRYVSIRHGGTNIGANNEINGLTMGGVGDGTTIDHVEVWYNADDGFEWFGGTVNCSYLVSAFNEDDSFDHDFGYSGKCKNLFSIQAPERGNHAGELSSNAENGDATPVAMPKFSNCTFIGAGADQTWAKSEVLHVKDATGGAWKNCIFTDFPGDKPLNIEDKASGTDSRQRLENGEFVLQNNIWYGIKNGNTVEGIAPGEDYTQAYLSDAANKNQITDPLLRGISRSADNGLDPRPNLGSPALGDDVYENMGDDWFDEEAPSYIGAFGPNTLWIKGWTLLDYAEYVYDGSSGTDIQVYDTDINPGETVNWTKNNTYHLNGFVFVEEGAKLYIEPGTVIKGKPGIGDQASALIIARGGKIYAEGTSDNPIIFTYEADDPNNYDELPLDIAGQWGGVIILGKASVNTATGVAQIEGIPSDNPKGEFGGGATPDDNDNSGVFRYVSIRHGGTNIGANNEINGLTMGGVGDGTTIDHVEVWYNDDDGFEWFGGTVNCSHLVSAFNADDSFDHDFGYSGKCKNLFSIQNEDAGNHAGELSSNAENGDATPVAMPKFSNCTFIGSGDSRAKSEVLHVKDATGGTWKNCIFTEIPGDKPLNIEDKASGTDSRQRLENGEFVLQNNIWYGIKNGNTVEGIAPGEDYTQAYLSDAANKNQITNPMLGGISRATDNGLDPRPIPGSPALGDDVYENMGDDWFDEEAPTYIGAFGPNTLWLKGWTVLDNAGYLYEGSQGADIQVYDTDINPGDDVRWTANNTYHLNGFVFVEEGAVLRIDAGTVIKGKPGIGDQASALIIARGGKIYAEGTSDNPIIFTYEADDPNNYDELPLDIAGQWGGVIILGKASVNTATGVAQIEGIPSDNPKGEFGGGATPDDNDNSGVFRYVSIRHGGTNIGANNEINGLTMGGVGDGTTIDHVEVWYNDDDGFEWFGGTVNCSHLVSAFNADDSFDHDFGYSGKCKNLFSIQNEDAGNHAGELSSNAENGDATPVAMPKFSNCTFIGSGDSRAKSEVLHVKDATGGTWKNCIFTEIPGDKPLNIEDKASGTDSRQRLENGEFVLQNNIWYGIKNGNTVEGIAPGEDYTQAYLSDAANKNQITNPMLGGISRATDNGLDPRPIPGSPALGDDVYENMGDDWFDEEAPTYIGAFGPNTLWLKGWTVLDNAGYLYEGSQGADIQVYDTDINPGDDVRWTANNTYHLNGFVFVEEGAVLRIDAGTVIKGKPGIGDQASALIIARGGKIYAEGTSDNPIIFTYEADDPHDMSDLPIDVKGQWGGVIILGKASVNTATGVAQIEGIPSDNPKGEFGGGATPDDNDNSGVFRYVSIRHGGTNIGANNEINGLTMGGVGAGTTIDHVEVVRNDDDGFEWFGGTVNCSHLVSAFNNDDSFDHDFGWQGKLQFLFSIQAEDEGNHSGELSSNSENGDAAPIASATAFNCTFIGSGKDASNAKSEVFDFKDATAGVWKNSVFTDFCGGKPLTIEDKASGTDSKQRLDDGEIVISNNIWWGFKGGNNVATIAADKDFIMSYLSNTDNKNWIVDPQLRGVSRDTDQKLDPRPVDMNSPCYTNEVASVPDDGFFTQTDYIGAFGADNWLRGWTFLDASGVVDPSSVVEEYVKGPAYDGIDVYPNPMTDFSTIRFSLSKASDVNIAVFNILGEKVVTLVNGTTMAAGNVSLKWTLENDLQAGMYVIVLETESYRKMQKVIIK